MRRRILLICMSLALLLGVFLVKDTGVWASEYYEGFQVVMNTDDELAAGAEVSFDITVTNISGKDLSHLMITHDYYDRSDTSGEPPLDSYFGQLFDENGQDVDEKVYEEGVNIEIKDGETQKYTLKGTLPDNWGDSHQIWIIVYGVPSGEENGDLYIGNTGTELSYPEEDAGSVYEDAYQVTVTPDQEVKPGQQVTFHVSITNQTEVAQQVTWLDMWYYQEIGNSETYPGVTFGEMKDAADHVIVDENRNGIADVSFEGGEKKEYTLTGVLPSTWGEKSEIIVVINSRDADGNEYRGQGSYTASEQPGRLDNVLTGRVTGNAGGMVAVSGKELIDAVLTAEDMLSGDDFEVVFHADILTEDSLNTEDKAAVLKAAGERNIAQILNLTVQKNNITRNTEETVSKLLSPIVITVQVPEEYRNVSGREFSVIRLHDGAAAVLEDEDQESDTVTFTTDEFSLYTLAYTDKAETNTVDTAVTPANSQDTGNSEVSGAAAVVVRAATPQTGDTENIVLYLMLCLAMAGTVAGIYIKKKRVLN